MITIYIMMYFIKKNQKGREKWHPFYKDKKYFQVWFTNLLLIHDYCQIKKG